MTTHLSGRSGNLGSGLLARVRAAWWRAEQRRILRQLDPRTLSDIGLSADDLEAELSRLLRRGA